MESDSSEEAEDAYALMVPRPQGDTSSSDDDEAGGGGAVFDPGLATRHTYLGELDDLPSSRNLEEGAVYEIPLLPQEGVVVFPGDSLPLGLAMQPAQRRSVELALTPKHNNFLAVVYIKLRRAVGRGLVGTLSSNVGCIAEIRQLRREEGSSAAIARGVRRFELLGVSEDGALATCKVLPEREAERVPRPAAVGAAHWASWAYRPYDAFALAAVARRLLLGVVPGAAAAARDLSSPLALSYWVARSMPLGDRARVDLLEAWSASERLRREIALLEEMDRLGCQGCDEEVGRVREAVCMSEEGPGASYVNPGGHVHDLITLRTVDPMVRLIGTPETEYSWFPGYAWTNAMCGSCGIHLGWRFTAVDKATRPKAFWGIRQQAIHQQQVERQHSEGRGGSDSE